MSQERSEKPRVLVCASWISPEGLRLLEAVADLTRLPDFAPEDDMIRAIRDVDAVLARIATISKAVIDAAPRLKIVSRHGVGVDSVDVAECTRQGILVTTTGDANSQAVAEHTFACLLSAVRMVPAADRTVKSGRWDHDAFTGTELYGKTLGLVGIGRIGARVARQAKAFDMQVIAYDPYASPAAAEQLGASLVDLETLLRRADFVSLHAPRTPETVDLIGKAQLDMMKPSAMLVNTARGGIVNEEALYEALSEHRIAGAALDAFTIEPLPSGHPLTTLDNVICTPHIGTQTEEALARMSARSAENILSVLAGDKPRDCVNPEALASTSRITWRSEGDDAQ